MAYTDPTIPDFKAYFSRDFIYGTTSDTVTDADIQRALDDAGCVINSMLFSSQAKFAVGYLLLAAHCIVMNLRASSQGVNGKHNGLQNSKSVGSVSESFAIPDRILANPEYAYLNETYYGAKFLFLILPQLSGQIFTVKGATQP